MRHNPFLSANNPTQPTTEPQGFHYLKCSDIEETDESIAWMIAGLWTDGHSGFIGGEPKSYKSTLALEMSVAVASGHPFLGRYEVPNPGPVLIFLAEDRLPYVRKRLVGICEQRGLDLANLPLYTLSDHRVKIDEEGHQAKLRSTISAVRPRFVLLDPFVRIHNIDENNVADVKRVLEYVMDVSREYQTSIGIVHHTNKHGTGGYALRGSGDIYGWAENLLFTEKVDREGQKTVRVSAELRYGPSPRPFRVTVRALENAAYALELIGDDGFEQSADPDLRMRVLEVLQKHGPQNVEGIWSHLRKSKEKIRDALNGLQQSSMVTSERGRYSVADRLQVQKAG